MKIRVLSDLHLEFTDNRYIDIPEGDVLILAGDVCLAEEVDEYYRFFLQCRSKYDKVYYVMGNHEHYYSNFKETLQTLRDGIPKGITLLQNQSELYNGVHFVGATMWTDFRGSGVAIEEARTYMNDYHLISGFTPEKAMEENDNTKEWFGQCIPMLKKAPVVMITHHPPSESSVKGRYTRMTPSYSNKMDKFIRDHPNITAWVHGHVHHNSDYMINQCRVMSNPMGYTGSEINPEFDVNFEFDVCYNIPDEYD